MSVLVVQDGPRGGVFLMQQGAQMLDRAINECLERHGAKPDFVILPEGWMNVFGTTSLETNESLRPLAETAAKVCQHATTPRASPSRKTNTPPSTTLDRIKCT